MKTNFQKAKLAVCFDQASGVGSAMKIPISMSLYEAYQKETGNNLRDAIANSSTGVRSSVDNIIIPFEVAKRRLFGPPITSIIEKVTHLMDKIRKLENLDYMMLVGGFGQCSLLQEALYEAFRHRTTVLLPLEAQVAVIRGAVRYGQDPSVIHSRRLGLTYGQNIYKPFDTKEHDEEHEAVVDDVRYAKDAFLVF